MIKYEFSYRGHEDHINFVTVFDHNIESAAERVLGREVRVGECRFTEHGNYLITGWENTHFTIHVMPYVAETSSHVEMHKSVVGEKFSKLLEGLT